MQGLSTEAKPVASRIKVLVNTIKIAQVSTIFVESTNTSKLMQTIAKDAGGNVSEATLFIDSLGEKNSRGGTYQTMLIANTKTLFRVFRGLGGTYTAFEAAPAASN